MNHLIRAYDVILFFILITHFQGCSNSSPTHVDKKFHLTSEAQRVARDLFIQGRNGYDQLKNRSLHTIDTVLDLVNIMNEQMAKELRSAVIKFYKVKYFHDFTNYAISIDEIIDMIEHCLVEPTVKLEEIRDHFHTVVKNFEDVRNFGTVERCHTELPDEVAAAHCILHQAVLFNETMQESLITIVEIKTRQHAEDMNSTLFEVQRCLTDFIPNFFEQLLVDSYTDGCSYLKVVNASISDLVKDRWRKSHEIIFPKKWTPFVSILKERPKSQKQSLYDPLFLTLFTANLTSKDVVTTLYS